MKGIFLVIAAVGCVALTSCEKNYHCTCTYTDVYNKTYTDDLTISLSKGDAKKACDENEASLQGTSTNVSCKFK